MEAMNQRHGDSDAKCTRGCGDWSGKLTQAEIQETQNGNGVNWMCPNCGDLVGTANY